MRKFLCFAVALAAFFGCLGFLLGAPQEGDVKSLIPVGHAGTEWLEVSGGGIWTGLVKDGTQIGAYNRETHEYFTIDPLSGGWVKGSERVYCREDAQAAIQLVRNPGVDWRRTQKEVGGYRVNGRAVSERDAFGALKPSPKLPDDSGLPSLTLIGTEAECRAVEEEINRSAILRPVRSSFLLQSYRPTDVMVSNYGFATGGRPTIYMTDAKGKVLFRADERPDAGTLADAVFQGVEQCCPPRKPHPDYEPKLDPDPERIIKRSSSWAWAWYLCGVLVCLIMGALATVVLAVLAAGAVKMVRYMMRAAPVVPETPVAPK